MDRPTNATRTEGLDDTGASGVDQQARKKFQRATGENDNPARRQSNIMSVGNQKGAFTGKRRSTLRENKAPLLGPRPLELQQSKRVISDTQSVSSSGTRTFLPTYSSQPALGQPPPKPSNNPRYSFSRHADQSEDTSLGGEFDFLPPVNFDDFHASITPSAAYEDHSTSQPSVFNTSGYHARTATQDSALGFGSSENIERGRKPAVGPAAAGGNKVEAKRERTLSRSLVRRLSNAKRQPAQTSSAMPPPSTQPMPQNRRQSTLPTSSSNSSIGTTGSRAPRKSVGPGAYTVNYGNSRTSEDNGRSSANTFTSQGGMSRNSSMSRQRRGTLQNQAPTQPEGPKLATTARAMKAKSMQPSSEQAQQARQYLSANSGTPITPSSPGLATNRSPARSPGLSTNTPTSGNSSSSKRQSVHVGGLGARTISPTDARRLKRLSQMPAALPTPGTPTTPQPDFLNPSRTPAPASPVPAVMARKSTTPSSARATPEASRKQSQPTLPNITLPPSSSMTSLRSQSGQAGNRSSQILTASRLPAPKPRNVQSSAGFVDEDVPPVPAIPRAYDSPKDLIDKPFFSETMPLPASAHNPRFPNFEHTFSSSVSSDTGAASTANTSTHEGKPGEPPNSETTHAAGQNPRHRRGLTVGTGGEPERAQGSQTAKRSTLQPIRLPPLNLLPLSTPTTNRINNFPAPSAEVDHRANAGTPANRIGNKTPSTPMTASKATFSRSIREDEDFASSFNTRSQTSHFNSKPDDTQFYTPQNGSPDINMSMPTQNMGGRSMPTPFSSGSLPKELGEFHYFTDSNPGSEPQSAQTESAPDFGALLPSQSKTSLTSQSQPAEKRLQPLPAPAPVAGPDEPETPSSGGSSLRRRLSLSWKRSGSKASKSRDGDEKAVQKNDMPPPKLPASATAHNVAKTGSPVPSTHSAGTTSGRPSIDSRRRKSSVNTVRSSMDVQGRSSGEAAFAPKGVQKSQADSTPHSSQTHGGQRTQSRTGSILTPVHKMLGSRSSISTLKARNLDTNLDRDDLAADRIMEKLASKRKDFESAARDVDELRKRAHAKERLSPAQALQMVSLNIFEKGEIIDYREIFFCGTKSAKKHVGDLSATPNASSHQNFGYDDDRGDYNIVLGDHLAYRYEVVDVLGKGSFGQVVRCIDHKTGGLCAVKIIRNKKRFHQQALVEVNILQKLREWDPDNRHSMISFTQSFYFRGHLCISTELLGMNLYEFIKAYEFKGFPLALIRRFAKQILSSLILLKGKRVIHCDLKPENILLAHPLHSEIKVIDFGSSCFENEKVYTYIQSRFYRSPEVILGMSYGIPIDMWSLGCILAELFTGYPIFPGENEQEQLACIMEIFGPPEKHLIEKSSRKKLFFDSLGKPRVTVSSKGRRRRPSSKTLQQALKTDDDGFCDFIARCLRWDPDRRMKPDEALTHEFVTGIKRSMPMLGPRVRSTHQAPALNNHAQAAATGAMVASSPAKRNMTTGQLQQTPASGSQRTRPLPEPPATSFRNGTAVSSTSNSTASPVKAGGAGPRRHSTVNGPNVAVARRTSNVNGGTGQFGTGLNMSGSNTGLPRVMSGNQVMSAAGPRSVSHGQFSRDQQHGGARSGDLASAAAVASLAQRAR